MTPVFADTSYYLAYINPNDEFHEIAVEFAQNLLGQIYVTEYVLIELGNALRIRSDRDAYVSTLALIDGDPNVTWVPASTGLFRQAVELFASRPDKEWSIVDCTSFVVMKQRRLREALTADRHFEQAGFRALLRQ